MTVSPFDNVLKQSCHWFIAATKVLSVRLTLTKRVNFKGSISAYSKGALLSCVEMIW